jgi:hypothetical protein
MTVVDYQPATWAAPRCFIQAVRRARVTAGGMTAHRDSLRPQDCGASVGAASKWSEKGCAQRAHPGLRLYRYRTGQDWGGFRGKWRFFKGERLVRVPSRAQCFPCSGRFLVSECGHFVHL